MSRIKTFQPRDLDDVASEVVDYEYSPDYGGPCHPALLPRAEMNVVWRPALERAVEEAQSNLLRVRGIAKSPIEERFLAALWVFSGWGCTDKVAIDEDGSAVAWMSDLSAEDRLTIHAQAQVGPYKTDFLTTLHIKKGAYTQHPEGVAVRVAVELDGHDFHEKTKAQAAHDKKRDRYFAAQGLTLLRFTGSEVHRDAPACADETLSLLCSKMRVVLGGGQ